jgi:hypothetical protein
MKTGLRFGLGFLLIGILLASSGCIRSRVRITSDPPKAMVRFQNEDRGETPITIPFIWYWYYDIELKKEGYEPEKTREYFRTPPWFLFPLDFFAEILPIPITDTRDRHYTLKPVQNP